MKRFYIFLITILIIKYCSSQNIIKLPEPKTEGGMPLNEALNNRKSSRDFDMSTGLTQEIISQALWSCYGTNRPNGYKTTPSATGWYPLIVYVFLEVGVFKYDPKKNTLTQILSGDYRYMTGTQTSIVTNARINFVFIADFKKKSSMDGDDEHKLRSIYLDTGHCSMALGLFAASNNMKGVPREMVEAEPLLELLGLSKEDYKFTLSFSLGY